MLVCCFGLMRDPNTSTKTLLIAQPGLDGETLNYTTAADSFGLTDVVKYGFGIGYAFYIIYILMVANWNYLFKKSKKN